MDNLKISSSSFIPGRGEFFCRGCLGKNLFSGLNLGLLPLANELLSTPEVTMQSYPLHLRICSDCGLGQVADVVTSERIFRNYRYLSSMSTTFLNHAAQFVDDKVEELEFKEEEWVLEIASNDGYLLKNFARHDIRVLGVEPAENIAQVAKNLGIETIVEFFTKELATEILLKHGFPRLIVANNVMAHVPDLIDFMEGLAVLTGPNTEIIIENPSIANILSNLQFDTIYHEHYSYLSATAISKICHNVGLKLVNVERVSTHGGSNRYSLAKVRPSNSLVQGFIQHEEELGLFDIQLWHELASKVDRVLLELARWFDDKEKSDRKIYAYGAAAKASTLLNSIPDYVSDLLGIADISDEKQGRYMPNLGIPIISPDQLIQESPTDVIIFPWNIMEEILSFLKGNLRDNVRYWCPIPEMHEVK